jgi:predicted nucleic acid-binding protein
MSAAYVDTSFLLAIIFDEPQASALRRRLGRYEQRLAGDLLRAEALSAARREDLSLDALGPALAAISLVLPERSLEREMRDVLGYGYLRGADLWHLACALFLADEDRSELVFLSCDAAQRRVARRLGFTTP